MECNIKIRNIHFIHRDTSADTFIWRRRVALKQEIKWNVTHVHRNHLPTDITPTRLLWTPSPGISASKPYLEYLYAISARENLQL